MPFRVAARTIFHLGAELISSDAIAFYELIKNAFDARSKRVDLNIFVRIPHEKYLEIKDELNQEMLRNISGEELKKAIIGLKRLFTVAIDTGAPNAWQLKQKVEGANSFSDLQDLLESANYIEIIDTGEGMSYEDLNDVYLTIGTRSRLEEREDQRLKFENSRKKGTNEVRPILGEKGVGRLSTMRLGNRLRVITSKKGEARWNILRIDWSRFSHESDELIENIEVSPTYGKIKEDPTVSGTTIKISALLSEWTKEKLVGIGKNEFSKLNDPFNPASRYRIALRFNKELIQIPEIDEVIFGYAHAVVEAGFEIEETETGRMQPVLFGRVDYLKKQRETFFRIEGANLLSIAKADSMRSLINLGPFKTKFFWFNRKFITLSEGIPEWQLIRDLIDLWAGGLMVFRDGFRVNPYGNPDDDWLDIDKKALASGGYKVNRRQIVGKVEISSLLNPLLVDQTNREGIRDSEEKEVLKNLLRHVILTEFKKFMERTDKEVQASEPLLNFADLEERVESQEKQARLSLKLLIKKYPQVQDETGIVGTIQEAVENLRSLIKQARVLAESYEKGRSELVHLAGLGLMVEILGHELNRATTHVLTTLNEQSNKNLSSEAESVFSTLRSQLITLQKRLRMLDPLATAGRQRKAPFDVVETIQNILKSHEAQFKRHHIALRFEILPERNNPSLKINAVEGMIVQIMENLIANSVYWLKQQKKVDKNFYPEILIVLNLQNREISITDNGPGVHPDRKELIFQPFVTTKPAGEGKGLGLYISREIANYNNAKVYLSNVTTIHPDKLNTFILQLESDSK